MHCILIAKKTIFQNSTLFEEDKHCSIMNRREAPQPSEEHYEKFTASITIRMKELNSFPLVSEAKKGHLLFTTLVEHHIGAS